MTNIIIIITVYTIGAIASYMMLRTEHVSEGRPYTYGIRVVNWLLSSLSWLMVLMALANAWVKMISKTGYWHKQIK